MDNNLFDEVRKNIENNKSNHLTIMHDTIVKHNLKTIVECGVDRRSIYLCVFRGHKKNNWKIIFI